MSEWTVFLGDAYRLRDLRRRRVCWCCIPFLISTLCRRCLTRFEQTPWIGIWRVSELVNYEVGVQERKWIMKLEWGSEWIMKSSEGSKWITKSMCIRTSLGLVRAEWIENWKCWKWNSKQMQMVYRVSSTENMKALICFLWIGGYGNGLKTVWIGVSWFQQAENVMYSDKTMSETYLDHVQSPGHWKCE